MNQLDDDWYNAWGSESTNDYNYDCCGQAWQSWGNYGGSIGNVAVLLARGEGRETNENDENQKQVRTSTGEWDPLKNTRRARPTTIHNRYSVLTIDCDDDDNDGDKAGRKE